MTMFDLQASPTTRSVRTTDGETRQTLVTCAANQCAAQVAVTNDVVNLVVGFNRVLTSRGERPLSRDEVVLCDACYRARRERNAEILNQAAAMLAGVRTDPRRLRERGWVKAREWLVKNGFGADVERAIELATSGRVNAPAL